MTSNTLGAKRARWAALAVVAGVALYLGATMFTSAGWARSKSGTGVKQVLVNVGASAFVPENDGCVRYNHTDYSGSLVDTGNCTYVAPVNLPEGWKIFQVKAFYNAGADDASVELQVNDDAGGHVDLLGGALDLVPPCVDVCQKSFELPDGQRVAVQNQLAGYGFRLQAGSDFVLYRVLVTLFKK